MTLRAFPVLWTPAERRLEEDTLLSVPWDFLAPHESQALANHSQTLECLASRGGLGPDEMCAVVENRRWVKMANEAAVIELRKHLASWWRTNSG